MPLSAKGAAKKAAGKPLGGSSSSSSSSSSSIDSLSKQLADVSAQAKGLGIDTRKADSVLAQTKAQGATPYAGSSYETAYNNTITSSALTPTTPIVIPPPAPPSTAGTEAMSKVQGIADAAKNPPPAPTDGMDALNKLIKSTTEAPNAEAIYKKTEQEAQLAEKQATVNNLSAQIGAITAKANADKLSLEGQGRGVTDVIIGGQQAKIDREAAIQSLPLSAQLAAAQGDLTSARDHVDTLFKIRLQDAQNKVDRKNKIAELVYNYATDQQKEALVDRRAKENRDFEIQMKNMSFANDLANTAFANGQSTLGSQFMKIDFTAADGGASQIANLSKGIAVKAKETGGGLGSPGFKDLETEQNVREYVVGLIDQIDAGSLTPEKAFSRARTYYGPQEVTDDALKALLGISGGTATTDTVNSSAIENEIASLKASPSGYSNDYIRAILKNKYGSSAVNNSSVGSIGDQLLDLLFIKN